MDHNSERPSFKVVLQALLYLILVFLVALDVSRKPSEKVYSIGSTPTSTTLLPCPDCPDKSSISLVKLKIHNEADQFEIVRNLTLSECLVFPDSYCAYNVTVTAGTVVFYGK